MYFVHLVLVFSLKRGNFTVFKSRLLNFPFWLICKVRYRRCCQKMWYSSSSKLDKVMHSIDYTGPTLSSSCVHKRAGFIIFKLMMGSEVGQKKTTCERPPQLILSILEHEILQTLSEIRHLGLSRNYLFRFPHSPN